MFVLRRSGQAWNQNMRFHPNIFSAGLFWVQYMFFSAVINCEYFDREVGLGLQKTEAV